MLDQQKIYRSRTDKEEAERQSREPRKQTLRLPEVGEVTMSVDSVDETHVGLTGRQALALLRLLEHHRPILEQEAEDERDRELGHGPGASPTEVPHTIRKGDSRIGKHAVSVTNAYDRRIEGRVTAILRYNNGSEQIEITRHVFALDSDTPGTETTWAHADDVDLL